MDADAQKKVEKLVRKRRATNVVKKVAVRDVAVHAQKNC